MTRRELATKGLVGLMGTLTGVLFAKQTLKPKPSEPMKESSFFSKPISGWRYRTYEEFTTEGVLLRSKIWILDSEYDYYYKHGHPHWDYLMKVYNEIRERFRKGETDFGYAIQNGVIYEVGYK